MNRLCHIAGSVANTLFLNGIVSAFIFLSFLDIVLQYFIVRRGFEISFGKCSLLELQPSEVGFMSTHHLLVVKGLIFKAMISSPWREGRQKDSMQQQILSLRHKQQEKKQNQTQSTFGMNSAMIKSNIYI